MGIGGSSGCHLVVFAALIVSSAAFLPSAVLPAAQTQLGASSSVCSVSMNQQRVAVVTGANKGIGLEVSRILGRQPGVLCVMGCRNAQVRCFICLPTPSSSYTIKSFQISSAVILLLLE